MATKYYKPFLVSVLLLVLSLPSIYLTDAQSIGVCNGQKANNLPSDQETVELYKSNSIGRMRMYGPNPSTLQALRGSGIELVLDVPNYRDLASDPSAAAQWVQDNVRNYFPDVKFRYIAVGNEVNPGDGSQFVLPAMQNVYDALAAAGLQDQIKVSTATYSALVSNPYPPSQGSFENDARSFMEPIIQFLVKTNAPLLANIYPYFAYVGDPQNIPLPYALFTAQDNQLGYQNLFDAMLDAMYSAVEKVGGDNVEIVVSESGWPSEGGNAATLDNASAYYRGLVNHVSVGTPKRPGRAIETYWFAMYDENQKGGEQTEQHFGLFYPNKQRKY